MNGGGEKYSEVAPPVATDASDQPWTTMDFEASTTQTWPGDSPMHPSEQAHMQVGSVLPSHQELTSMVPAHPSSQMTWAASGPDETSGQAWTAGGSGGASSHTWAASGSSEQRRNSQQSAPQVSIMVPADRSPRVIGKAGTGLKQIREACGRKVEAKSETLSDGVTSVLRLVLSGSVEQISMAFGVAMRRAHVDLIPGTAVSSQLHIPAEWAGYVIGKGGENIKRVRSMGIGATMGKENCLNPETGAEERMLQLEGNLDSLPFALTSALDPVRHLLPGGLSANGGGGCSAGGLSMQLVPPQFATGMGQVMPAQGPRANDFGTGPSDPEEVCLHLSIPDNMAGNVLGSGGARIKETSSRSDAKLRLTRRESHSSGDPRRVIIVGSLQAVSAAQTMLNDQLSEAYVNNGQPAPEDFAITMQLRREVCGAIIGKQGHGIREIKASSGAQMTLKDQSEVHNCRPCFMHGPISSVLEAQRLIHEIQRSVPMSEANGVQTTGAQQGPTADQFHNGAVACSAGAVGYAAVDVPPTKRTRLEGETFGLEPETKFLVPGPTVGAIIGKQGCTLKAIREQCGVRVEVKKEEEAPQWATDRVVICKGSSESRGSAVEQILSIVQAHNTQASSPNGVIKMLIPIGKVAHLMRDSGSNLTWLQSSFGVQPVIGNQEVMGDYLLSMFGAPANVSEATKQVIQLMDGEPTQAMINPQRSAPHGLYAMVPQQQASTVGMDVPMQPNFVAGKELESGAWQTNAPQWLNTMGAQAYPQVPSMNPWP